MATEPLAPLPLPSLFTHIPPANLLTQGAEALLYRTHFLTTSTPSILKYRPSKAYRHPTLDKRLTRHRILSEARTLVKCRREGVPVPGVLGLDAEGAQSAGLSSNKDDDDPAGADLGNRKGQEVRKGELHDGRGGWIMLEYIPGKTVRETLQLRRQRLKAQAQAEEAGGDAGTDVAEHEEQSIAHLMGQIGRAVGRLHEVGVIHGDLTTSNMILRPPSSSSIKPSTTPDAASAPKHNTADDTTSLRPSDVNASSGETPTLSSHLDGDIVLIDFGLATQSLQDEDKAVDLYVLERAFGSTHPEAEVGFHEVLKAYGKSYRGAKVVLARLEDVRLRGRKRSMLG